MAFAIRPGVYLKNFIVLSPFVCRFQKEVIHLKPVGFSIPVVCVVYIASMVQSRRGFPMKVKFFYAFTALILVLSLCVGRGIRSF